MSKYKAKRPRPPGSGKRGPIKGEGGGPRKDVFSPEQLVKLTTLAEIGATRAEMAALLGVDEDTIYRRLADTPAVGEAIKAGNARLRTSLRRRQVMIALNDKHPQQATMLIWCGKVILGQSERVHLKIDSEQDALERLRLLLSLPSLPPALPSGVLTLPESSVVAGDGE